MLASTPLFTNLFMGAPVLKTHQVDFICPGSPVGFFRPDHFTIGFRSLIVKFGYASPNPLRIGQIFMTSHCRFLALYTTGFSMS